MDYNISFQKSIHSYLNKSVSINWENIVRKNLTEEQKKSIEDENNFQEALQHAIISGQMKVNNLVK